MKFLKKKPSPEIVHGDNYSNIGVVIKSGDKQTLDTFVSSALLLMASPAGDEVKKHALTILQALGAPPTNISNCSITTAHTPEETEKD